MLKASFILVIALGVGALAIGQFQVAPKISQLQTDLAAAESRAQQAETAQRSAERAERDAKAEAEQLRGDLADTQTKLEETTRVAQQQRVRADDLQSQLSQTMSERNEAQRSLAAWRALGVTIAAVQSMKSDLLGAREEINAMNAEKVILMRKVGQLEYDLSRYVGPNVKVALPKGLKGTVVAVNPQWDFVVLDIGEKDGVRSAGQLMVSRDGKLVGKVRVSNVQADKSVANVLPEWKQADIQVGDVVLY